MKISIRGISRNNILGFVISIYLFRLFFPLPFLYMPSPLDSHYLWASVLFFAFLMLYPKAYISKSMVPLYLFFLIFFIFIPLFWAERYRFFSTEIGDTPSIEGFVKTYFPLFIALLVFHYYIDRKDYKSLGKTCLRAWLFALLGTINTLLILLIYPRAMIDVVGAGVRYEGDILVKEFSSMGFLGYGFLNAISSVFPIFVYFIIKTNIRVWQKILWTLFASIAWFTITRGTVTAFLLFSTIFGIMALIMKDNYLKDIRRLVFVTVIVILLPSSFTAGLFYRASDYFPESKIGIRLYDAGLTIENPDIDYYGSRQHAGRRLGRSPILWDSFLSNPLIGGGLTSKHVAWLDMLSVYGLLGFLPWAYLVFKNFRNNLTILPSSYSGYYMLCVLAFVIMGFLKAQGGSHVYIYWFLIVPGSAFIYLPKYNIISSYNDAGIKITQTH